MADIKSKDELKGILDRARAEHLRIFKEELSRGELNGFFSQLIEYKRRKWIESALADNTPEALMGMLEILDAEAEGPEDEKSEENQ